MGERYPFISYHTYMEFCHATEIIEDATGKNIEDAKRRSGLDHEAK